MFLVAQDDIDDVILGGYLFLSQGILLTEAKEYPLLTKASCTNEMHSQNVFPANYFTLS